MEYTGFSGLVVGMRVKRIGGEHWARFHARFDPAGAPLGRGRGPGNDAGCVAREAMLESEAINARFGGGAYRLPEHKGDDLTMSRDALLVEVPVAGGRGG